jgi:hypothetical protein
MATTEPKCANCEKTGLPILPVRYTALPEAMTAKLPDGVSGAGVTDVTLDRHKYGLRILREGWLYLFYVKGARGSNYWEVYKVTEDGRLWKQTLPLPATPVTDPACAKKSIAVPMDIIAIEQPEKCTEVYVAFSEHTWLDSTFKLYAESDTLRKQRMQCIEPSKWIKGTKPTHGHAAVATEQSIDEIVEYMPGLDPDLLQPRHHPLSEASGKYDPAVVKRESTRYPLYIRQATPASTSAALVRLMKDVGETTHDKSHPPMVLALWDGIGNAHELNGFRNDAGSMLAIYTRERAMQIDAMMSIDAAEVAVRNGAVESKSRWRSSLRAGWEALLNSGGGGGLDGIPVAPPPLSAEDEAASEQRIRDAGKISPQEAKKIGDAAWPQYQKELVLPKLNAFRPWFTSIQNAVSQIQSKRTPDVEAWLKAPTFLATLHDYRDDDLSDGIAFEAVVAEAINGLPSEDSGAKVMEGLINNMNPNAVESLVWRAFTYNQKEPKAEIKELLAQATAHKSTLIEKASEGAETVNKALEKLKTFVELREKMSEVKEHEHPVSATERYLKNHHGDRLIVTMGDGLFKWTGLGLLGDCVGTFMIRGALMLRVGISQADTIGLIKQAAKVEPAMRLKLQNGYRAQRTKGVPAGEAYIQTLQSLAADDDGKVYRAKWAAVKLTEEGKSINVGVRIGGTLAVIELLSFGCGLAKADKNGEDYAMLVAGGFSSMSACLQASTKLMTGLGKDAAQTLANLKAVTGYFGGASAMIGAVVDFGKGAEESKKGRYATALLYRVKGLLGLAATGANLLTALTSSAPLIARVTGVRSVAWLGKAGAGIAGAEARAGALAGSAATNAAKAAGMTAMDVAAEEAGVVIGERAALLLIGRTVLILAGWEVAVVITVIQVLIWYFSDDDLQTWLEKCGFGKSPPSNPPWTVDKQHEEFEKALKALGLASEGSE